MKVYASLVKSENLAVWGLLLGLSREGTPMGQDKAQPRGPSAHHSCHSHGAASLVCATYNPPPEPQLCLCFLIWPPCASVSSSVQWGR